jgi:hypothetical protein
MPLLAIVSRVAEETAPTFATLPPFAFKRPTNSFTHPL